MKIIGGIFLVVFLWCVGAIIYASVAQPWSEGPGTISPVKTEATQQRAPAGATNRVIDKDGHTVIGYVVNNKYVPLDASAPAAVDYDALAKQYGGTPATKNAQELAHAKLNHAFVKEEATLRNLCFWDTQHERLGCFQSDSTIANLLPGDDVVLLSAPQRTPYGVVVRKVRFQQWVGWTWEKNLSNIKPE